MPDSTQGSVRRYLSILALLLAAVMVLAACGVDDADDGVADDVPAEDDSADPEQDSAQDEEGSGDPVHGGAFLYAQVGTQDPYDPLIRGGDPIMNAVYDKLLRVGPSGEVEAYLAESLETDDAQIYTLTLREGVNFHDGNPLDADAVIFNIERHMDPDNASRAGADVSGIAELNRVDDLTVEIVLGSPNAALPQAFTRNLGHIASPAAIEAYGDDHGVQAAVGAGPFLFDRWEQDQRTVVTRNPDYWQEDLPFLDEFQEIPMSDTQSRMAAFQAGELDAAWFQEAREQQWALDNPDLAAMYAPEGAIGGTGIVFNLDRAPLDDIRVREAIMYATDYDGLDQALFDGTMPRQRGPFDGTIWETGVDWPDHDLARAQELVAEYEAETGESVSFELGCHSAPDRRRWAEVMQQMLTQANMEVELSIVDVSEYVSAVFSQDFTVGCFPKNGDDPDDLYEHFHSEGASTANFFGYSNGDADAALERGRSNVELEERQAAYSEWEQYIREDLPMVWHWGPVFSFITTAETEGVSVNPMTPTDWQVQYLWVPAGDG